jgi:hypothetical protein
MTKRSTRSRCSPPPEAAAIGGAEAPALRAAILDLALRRAPGGSFCPSEVARALGGDGWRALMPVVRAAAAAMPEVEATQGGVPVAPEGARGPIRLRLRRADGPAPLAPGPAEE